MEQQRTNKDNSNTENETTGSNMANVQKQKAIRPIGPMTVEHEQWDDFIDSLLDAGGCDGTDAFPITRRILAEMGLTPTEVEQSISYYRQHGGFCDCEIVLNVDQFAAL